MNFVFKIKIMKLKFQKEESIAEDSMMDECCGLNFLLPKHKVLKNLPVAPPKLMWCQEMERENSWEEMG